MGLTASSEAAFLSASIRGGNLVEVRSAIHKNGKLAKAHLERDGATAWHLVAWEGRLDMLELMHDSILAHQLTKTKYRRNPALVADELKHLVNKRNILGQRALSLACLRGHADCAAWLLAKGADPWSRAGEMVGELSALHYCVKMGHWACLQVLLTFVAASPALSLQRFGTRYADLRSSSLLTPLHYAAWYNRKEMVSLLFSHGAILTRQCYYNSFNEEVKMTQGSTPLHVAARLGRGGVTRELLTAYAARLAQARQSTDPRLLRDGHHCIPFSVAMRYHHYHVVTWLHPMTPLASVVDSTDPTRRVLGPPKLLQIVAPIAQQVLLSSLDALALQLQERRVVPAAALPVPHAPPPPAAPSAAPPPAERAPLPAGLATVTAAVAIPSHVTGSSAVAACSPAAEPVISPFASPSRQAAFAAVGMPSPRQSADAASSTATAAGAAAAAAAAAASPQRGGPAAGRSGSGRVSSSGLRQSQDGSVPPRLAMLSAGVAAVAAVTSASIAAAGAHLGHTEPPPAPFDRSRSVRGLHRLASRHSSSVGGGQARDALRSLGGGPGAGVLANAMDMARIERLASGIRQPLQLAPRSADAALGEGAFSLPPALFALVSASHGEVRRAHSHSLFSLRGDLLRRAPSTSTAAGPLDPSAPLSADRSTDPPSSHLDSAYPSGPISFDLGSSGPVSYDRPSPTLPVALSGRASFSLTGALLPAHELPRLLIERMSGGTAGAACPVSARSAAAAAAAAGAATRFSQRSASGMMGRHRTSAGMLSAMSGGAGMLDSIPDMMDSDGAWEPPAAREYHASVLSMVASLRDVSALVMATRPAATAEEEDGASGSGTAGEQRAAGDGSAVADDQQWAAQAMSELTTAVTGILDSHAACGEDAAADELERMCGVCMDDDPEFLVLQPCMHRMCLSCCRELVKLHTFKPTLCPFCRRVLLGFDLPFLE